MATTPETSTLQRTLEIRLTPTPKTIDDYRITFHSSESVSDGDEVMISLLDELVDKRKYFALNLEQSTEDDVLVLEFTLTEGQDSVDVHLTNLLPDAEAIATLLKDIRADLVGLQVA